VSGDRDWREYEQQIHERLKRLAGEDAEIRFDVKMPGRFSGVERQIDILVRGRFPGFGEATMAVDCKCFSRNVDVKGVETVMGLVEEVGTDLGLIVTTEGYSEGAKRRARSARGMQLDVVPYDDLADWEPDLEWCKVCTDMESERFPGGVYMQAFDRANPPEGGDFATGVGRCEMCEAVHVRCTCGTMTAAHEAEHGEWLHCEAGCGMQWRVEIEVDRDGIPLTDDVREIVSFRAASA
jgi:hypothetical protein